MSNDWRVILLSEIRKIKNQISFCVFTNGQALNLPAKNARTCSENRAIT